jgi:CHAD domain-containing protein
MNFSLSSKTNLAESLARVTQGEIDDLVQRTAGASASAERLDEAVHETRKSIKRLRALLRLYRGALGHALYVREDARLREIAHSLGGARDAVALRESFSRLLESAPAADRARLTDHRAALASVLDDEPVANTDELVVMLRSAHDALGELRERAPSFTVEKTGWSAIAPGFRRTYARGRRHLSRAVHRPTEKRLHTLRIDVKRHQYQLTLLEPLWPEPVKAFRQEVQKLGELLGHDHDLALLERRFDALRDQPELSSLGRSFRNATEHRHAELRREAFDLGARVYAEMPGMLLARYREYFDAWV